MKIVISGHSQLRRLKQATTALHQLAERHVRILDADATIADYRSYLAAMLGYHGPLEDRFTAHTELQATGFDAAGRRKTSLLCDDLAALGDDPWATPRCGRLPATTSLPRALGVAYVLEGSTLGGRFILARLPVQLAGLRGRATAFLAGYGGETGARWRSFAAIVERAVTTASAEDEAVAAARETFARLIDWLAAHTRAASPVLQEAS